MQKSSDDVPENLVNGEDIARELMQLFAKELKRRLVDGAKDMSPSELEVVRKVLSDNSVTLASIKRGDFGAVAKKAADDFPFPETLVASNPKLTVQ